MVRWCHRRSRTRTTTVQQQNKIMIIIMHIDMLLLVCVAFLLASKKRTFATICYVICWDSDSHPSEVEQRERWIVRGGRHYGQWGARVNEQRWSITYTQKMTWADGGWSGAHLCNMRLRSYTLKVVSIASRSGSVVLQTTTTTTDARIENSWKILLRKL